MQFYRGKKIKNKNQVYSLIIINVHLEITLLYKG